MHSSRPISKSTPMKKAQLFFPILIPLYMSIVVSVIPHNLFIYCLMRVLSKTYLDCVSS